MKYLLALFLGLATANLATAQISGGGISGGGSATPSGAAGGSLAGTYPNPTFGPIAAHTFLCNATSSSAAPTECTALNSTPVGATTASTGAFSTLGATGLLTATGGMRITGANTLTMSGSYSIGSSTSPNFFGVNGVVTGSVDNAVEFAPLYANITYTNFVKTLAPFTVPGLLINSRFSGVGDVGLFGGIEGAARQTGQTGNQGAGILSYFVGGTFTASATANEGGTSGAGNGYGTAFGTNPFCTLASGATFWRGCVGEEINTEVRTGASVEDKVGLQIIQMSDDAVAGTLENSALVIGNQAGAVGWDIGIAFGQYFNSWPMTAAGTLIGCSASTHTGSCGTTAHGIDFSNVTLTSDAFKSTGFSVDGSGNVSAVALGTSGLFSPALGITATGAVISLNASSNFNTNINTGTSTGTVTIGQNTATPSSIVLKGPVSFQASTAYSGATWATVSPVWNMAAATLNDTTASGTVTVEGAYSIQQPTFTSTGGASTTITSAASLWVAAPTCTGGLVCTSLYSAYFNGGTRTNGNITGVAGANISNGTINLNASSNLATNINTGTSTGTVTIGQNAASPSSIVLAGPVSFTGGTAFTGASWSTTSPVWNAAAITLNDTTASGTVATETGQSLQAVNFTSTGGASTTITNASTLWVAAPTCSGGLVCTNLYSINVAGALRVNGGGILTGGTISINPSSNNTFSVNTGTSSGTINIGNGSGNNTIGIGNGTGVVTGASPWTFSNATVKMTGITTGTNADTVCLKADGTLLIQAAACTISSLRFKEQVQDVQASTIPEIANMRVASFRMKDSQGNRDPNASSQQVGLIAENIAKVAPECALYENDMKTPKSYRQECVIALLVKGMQEQQGQVVALKARIAQLEGHP